MVFLAKHLAGPRWQTLSVPRGQSEQFNQIPRLRPDRCRGFARNDNAKGARRRRGRRVPVHRSGRRRAA
ncbi:MAG: DUF1572 domain-containing protein [Acidobacteria bacterium]|nr:DUF1572 domain-containing protein [Acidobacteriota bacterium]